MKSNFLKMGIAGICTSVLLFGSSSLTLAKENSSEPQLTKAQQLELKKAKEKEQQLLKNWSNKISQDTIKEYAKDKKLTLKKDSIGKYSVSSSSSKYSIGSKGDILYTNSKGSSSGSWAGGHIAVVINGNNTVEAFHKSVTSKDGVRLWPNDWKKRYKKIKGLWVRKATDKDYNYAASYARGQVGKKYNINFWNKKTTKKFYCSQLAWRAWYNKGYNLDDGGAVWPIDIYEDKQTKTFYSKG
ncbi:YiiX/YebB-like N1pC/P60 family cysteine hydrolase [Fictibacillus sp. Mic-4]|uniref:YiiX/YebB-like N1pC/P60 family cysteine hydrolase n=1 Tax=Fictibacillus sp. Mic-4 TaxID=3132826 RepID=UPI003CEA465D